MKTRCQALTKPAAAWACAICGLVLLCVVALPTTGAKTSIRTSKHNLSVAGPGEIRAQTESEICVFCHTSHLSATETPMWNRGSSGAIYIPYSSTTAKAVIGQPTGTSKLCLGCHDGTIAPGLLHDRKSEVRMHGPPGGKVRGPAVLGTDLSDDHPLSFTYDAALASANGQLRPPSALTGPVQLDENGQLQCTACHDPHSNQYEKMLVMNNYASALCTTCHNQKQWSSSAHQSSPKSWNGVKPNPWPHTRQTTVLANGCENCHRPHSAGTRQRLLNFAGEEQNCYPCHNGHVAAKNIEAEFNKPSVHPVNNTAVLHDPAEDPINSRRHVACSDCHNPHAARAESATAPEAGGTLVGVKGVSTAGSVVNPLTKQYELCFRCHADSTDRGAARVSRQFVQTNTRLEFQRSNASYHPVEELGRNPNVPSLISPWTTASLLYCTDCHNNNQGPGTGGTGPNGPHGSAYVPLLERRLELTDGQAESSAAYALCYKCHSRTSILGNQSFPEHSRHVGGTVKAACTTCHDPHGVANVPHLINFNTFYVTAYDGQINFTDRGTRHGSCQLSCHGQPHTGTGAFSY